VAALDSGALKVYRLYGLAPLERPAAARKGKGKGKKKAAAPEA